MLQLCGDGSLASVRYAVRVKKLFMESAVEQSQGLLDNCNMS